MKNEIEFLDYIEKQLISAGETFYTCWLRSEILFRKSELKDQKQ